MKTIKTYSVSVLTAMAFASANATDITIWDGVGVGYEDNEVEPGCAQGQVWDLEAFQLNGNTLRLVGGFNFLIGYGGYSSGDIFIDVNRDAVYGKDVYGGGSGGLQPDSNAAYHYDYVIYWPKVGSITDGYSVYALTENSKLLTVSYRQNDSSNPYLFVYTNEREVSTHQGFVFGKYLGTEYQNWGGDSTRYYVDFDLTWLAGAGGSEGPSGLPDGTLFHFTMGCGNDNLMGKIQGVPDAASTLMLLGIGMLGIGAVRRKLS